MATEVRPEGVVGRPPFAAPGWGISLLAIAGLLIAVAGGIVIGRNIESEPVGLVPQATVRLIDESIAAWRSADR